MSNKKTRSQKQRAEERKKAHNAQVKELEALKTKAIELESKIAKQKKENFKRLNIRNLKVFANACNFAAPFVISTGILAGIIDFNGGGLPFKLDEITQYKYYNLDFQTNGYITMDEEYDDFDSSPSNNLVVYTPWEENNGQYVRYKREYDVEDLATLDLYNAVLNEDYTYISEYLEKYKEEKQIINKIDLAEDNNYFFEASLHILDEEDTLKYNETDSVNKFITIFELAFGLCIGVLITCLRNFEFLHELRKINGEYKYRISSIKPMKQELKDTNEKILSLTESKGGKN